MNILKGVFWAMVVILVMSCPSLIEGSTGPTDKDLVERYCEQEYPGYSVVYTENPMPESHKSDCMVLVSIEKSTSNGDGSGTTWDGYYIAYNEAVSDGKVVTSYLVWNPDNNVEDDVVAVVDNGKIRG